VPVLLGNNYKVCNLVEKLPPVSRYGPLYEAFFLCSPLDQQFEVGLDLCPSL
jgi:hypothetical protein